jgi:hypothetical protein
MGTGANQINVVYDTGSDVRFITSDNIYIAFGSGDHRLQELRCKHLQSRHFNGIQKVK